jgi:hypothetical protein
MPGVRIVPTKVPCEASVREDIAAAIDDALDEIIGALTRPLSDQEAAPKLLEVEKSSRIIFKGDFDEFNLFFYKRGWGDGLPLKPPTEAAVAEMMTGTDLPPDQVIGELIPRLGKITIEKIAINAVMAGALPTYMPVLIAGVRAVLDPASNFGTWGVSTGSWSPLWIISGPIAEDLNINSGTGALSPGDIANAAIGRAMGLIIKNIGGIRKGVEDMGTLGNPGKYSMVVAENEKESPWEPLRVEHGLGAQDSAITVGSPNTYVQIWPLGTDDEGILRAICYNLLPKGGPCIMITPQHAQILAKRGWTKAEVKAFIAQHSRVPAYHVSSFWGSSSPKNTPGKPAGLFKGRVPMRDSDTVSTVGGDPRAITILVAGGPGAFIGLHMPMGIFAAGKAALTKIELPANWNQIVKKYKGVKPNYARY